MSMLNRIHSLISQAHDEVLICRKWDLRRRDHLLQAAYGRLYPFTHRYYFEGNPSFLNDYAGFTDMARYPLIMLRDGLVSLSAFFLTNHRPPSFCDTIFLIDGRFEPVVPKSWRERVAFYKVNFPTSSSPKSSLVLCSVAHHFLDYKDSDKAFKQIKSKLRAEPLFYFPLRERCVVQSVDETPYLQKGMRSLYNEFGTSPYIETDNNKIMELPLKEGDEVWDLYEDLLFAPDNYLHHWFASKNVQAPSGDLEVPEDHIQYALSLHHSLSIYEPTESLGSAYSEVAVSFKLSGASAQPTNEKFIEFIQGLAKKLF